MESVGWNSCSSIKTLLHHITEAFDLLQTCFSGLFSKARKNVKELSQKHRFHFVNMQNSIDLWIFSKIMLTLLPLLFWIDLNEMQTIFLLFSVGIWIVLFAGSCASILRSTNYRLDARRLRNVWLWIHLRWVVHVFQYFVWFNDSLRSEKSKSSPRSLNKILNLLQSGGVINNSALAFSASWFD